MSTKTRVLGTTLASTLALGALAVTGCNEHPLKPVSLEGEIAGTGTVDLVVNRDVDILFVIDNSGSMGDEQANLARNFSSFIDVLEHEDVRANYRIGITTSDSGSPVCKETTPEKGALRMSSCTDRLTDFVFAPGEPYEIDVQDVACSDVCTRGGEFDVLASVSHDGKNTKRKWLESQNGNTNIPDDWTMAEAFQCVGPQGINGCGFESQLESMYRSLSLTNNAESNQFSFMRPNAILAIVIVTDELDCSYNSDFGSIFLPSGQKTFWNDKDSGTPASGICWNAGVACTGGDGFGTEYSECHSASYDANGKSVANTAADNQAVLHPVSRYTKLIDALEAEKKKSNPFQEVIVGVLAGVPEGFNNGDSELSYYAADNAEQNHTFGVGTGCTGADGQNAYPPVRMREFADRYGTNNLYSICDQDFSPALEQIANQIKEQIRPACYGGCVEDMDAQQDGLQVECTVEQTIPGENKTEVPECSKDSDGSYRYKDEDYVLPAGADACFVELSDFEDVTSSKLDNMSSECQDLGANLEFKLVRREGKDVPGGTRVEAECKLTEFADTQCPDLI